MLLLCFLLGLQRQDDSRMKNYVKALEHLQRRKPLSLVCYQPQLSLYGWRRNPAPGQDTAIVNLLSSVLKQINSLSDDLLASLTAGGVISLEFKL